MQVGGMGIKSNRHRFYSRAPCPLYYGFQNPGVPLMYPIENPDSSHGALVFFQPRGVGPDFHDLLFALPHAQLWPPIRRHTQFPGAFFFRSLATFAFTTATATASASTFIFFAHVPPLATL